MALIITEEQKMLKDSASELFMAKATVIQMRKLRDTQYTPFDQSLWEEMVAMGWTALTVPENYNGLDFGFVGLGQILEEAGKNLSKSPLISSILLGASALRLSDNEALKVRSFPGVMEGTSQLAFAIQEGKHHQTTSFKTQAVLEGENYIINGSKTIVIDGSTASQLIVVCQVDANLNLFIVDANSEGITISKKILKSLIEKENLSMLRVKGSVRNRVNTIIDHLEGR